MKQFVLPLLASGTAAFPFVAKLPGVDTRLLARQQSGEGAGSEANCPFNADHVDAAPATAEYPYNNAINGSVGNQKGGFLVPAEGDTAHQYIAPTSTDIRGPCPGLNTAANRTSII